MLNQTVMDNTLLTNGTYNLALMEEAIQEIRNQSFSNLYEYQKELVNLRRYDLKVRDFIYVSDLGKNVTYFSRKYVKTIQAEFIHPKKRVQFRRSSYYNRELTLAEISKNSDLFSFTFMPFINGQFIDCLNIIPKDTGLDIVIDLKDGKVTDAITSEYYDQLIASDATMSFFILPNSAYGAYSTNVNVLNKYKNELELDRFNIQNNLSTDTKYITFINTNQMLFSGVITDTTNSADMLRFVSGNSTYPETSKYVHLNVFGLKNIWDQVTVNAGVKFFSLPILDMPIPPENMMIFVNDASGRKTFAHGITLKMYYPNVYEVIGNTTNAKLSIYTFFFDTPNVSTVDFTNDIELYQSLVPSYLSKYPSTIPPVIRDYMPTNFKYSIDNYTKSSTPADTVKYKINKLNEMIDENPNLLKNYLYRQVKGPSSIILDMSTVNLTAKIRNDNKTEIKNTLEQETFTEPRYVFILKNEGSTYQDIRFYIDGLVYAPDKKYRTDRYEYYYIPVSAITSTSTLEIEKYSSANIKKEVVYTTLSKVETFTVPVDARISRNHIFLIDKNTGVYIDKAKYKVSYMKGTTKVDLGQMSYLVVDSGQYLIELKDSALLNKTLIIQALRGTWYKPFTVDSQDSIGDSYVVPYGIIPDKRNFRIFKNGRFIQPSLYSIELSPTFNGETYITPLLYKNIGDEFVIDYTPSAFNQIYEQKDLPVDGILDLKGKINKPFDLKWYTLYINGRRLAKNNIVVISPTLIAIRGIKSRKNLLIMERDRDEELLFIGPQAKSIIDRVWELDSVFQNAFRATQPNLTDTEVDIITEVITEQSLELKRFYDKYVKTGFGFINPDVKQLDDASKIDFPDLIPGQIMFLNPNREEYVRNVLALKIFPTV